MTVPTIAQKNLLLPIYFASLFYSFHYALPLYVDSLFISSFVSTKNTVGLVFSVAALLTIIAILTLPRLLKHFGNYRVTTTAIVLEIILLVSLAFFTKPFLIIPAFILHHVLLNILYLNLDSLLEAFSSDATTGKTRGIFLTIVNAAVVMAPFLAGLLLSDHDFWKIYLLSAVFMVGMYIIITTNFKNYRDPEYEIPPFRKTLQIVSQNHDLRSIIFIHFLLNFFFAWMVIYTPIYLHTEMGISMSDILTVIVPIALAPFVIFEIFLGKIADRRFGEKEILAIGFLIMGVTTALLSFIGTASIAIWAIALFCTRTGASAVEIMAESYFYKQIGPRDMHLMTFMRTVRSGAYLIGPIAGTLVLAYIDYRLLFMILGAIMLAGIPYSLSLKDTR